MESIIVARQEYLNELKAIENPEDISNIKSKKPKCLLDTLLTVEIGQEHLSFKEIRDEVNTFVFAVSKSLAYKNQNFKNEFSF